MLRSSFWIFLLTLITNLTFAQSSSFDVKGIVEDTLGNPLIYTSVLLLEASDSTMVSFERTALDGSFKFDDIEAGKYIINTTYVGYLAVYTPIEGNKETIDLGIIPMKEIPTQLMEVVIKAAKAPIKMRGDTIEYDATTFKIPQGSSVEDLLRRLPGMEVESDGSLKSDGKDITKVTVDGKSFFGSDPKAATKNLPAEGISKVQVFDTKTEQEEITGSTGESQEKTMNLELKEDYKSGGFGKVTAGAGTQDRRELKGNYNKFNKKIQFSIVGVGNNTGRNGLSWDDYQDFMGSQSFNFSDGGDYGFSSGRGYYTFGGGGGNGIENSIRSIFFNNGADAGFPENYNGGVNLNYDHNKDKITAVYYYNQQNLFKETNSSADKFFPSFTQSEIRGNTGDDNSEGHRTELKYEREIDSLHTVKFDFNGAYVDEFNTNAGNLSLSRNDTLTTSTSIDNDNTQNGYLVNGMLLLRKKFMKKGRSLGANISLLNTELDDTSLRQSLINSYNDQGEITSTRSINQRNVGVASKSLWKANFLFAEPISKRFFFQTFYNYRNRQEDGDREVNDVLNNEESLNENLSRSYDNTIQYQRGGASLRYAHNGYNISAGLAYQHFDLKGLFSTREANSETEVNRIFENYIPNVSFEVSAFRNTYMSINYSKYASEPEIADLTPFVDNSNPLYIREGNPALTPSLYHTVSGYISKNWPLSAVRINMNLSYDYYENQISRQEIVDTDLITTVKPINLEGGDRASIWSSLSFPIVRNKFTARLSFSGSLDDRPSLVNEVLNNTRIIAYRPSLRLNITPAKDFAMYVNGRYNYTKTSYDINTSQDQIVNNSSIGVELNTKLIAGIFLESSFDVDQFTNDRFGVNQTIPILNASIYRLFTKAKKIELRASLYDGLNRNIGFNQYAGGITVSQSQTNAIGRYIMFSISYNIRGIKSDVRNDGWW